MTLAIEVIANAGNLSNTGEAADILLGYELATGMSLGDSIEWSDLPLGSGSDLIGFAQSYAYRNLPGCRSYGDIARAWLDYRLAYFGARMEPATP